MYQRCKYSGYACIECLTVAQYVVEYGMIVLVSFPFATNFAALHSYQTQPVDTSVYARINFSHRIEK